MFGDLTQPKTLLPDHFRGVSRVINCASVLVGPKEGDTQDRQKYYQVPLSLDISMYRSYHHYTHQARTLFLCFSLERIRNRTQTAQNL